MFSYVDNLHLAVDHFSKSQGICKVEYFIDLGIDYRPAVADQSKTDLGLLMNIIGSNFGHGRVEMISHPTDNGLYDFSLCFQRTTIVQPKGNDADTDNHIVYLFPRQTHLGIPLKQSRLNSDKTAGYAADSLGKTLMRLPSPLLSLLGYGKCADPVYLFQNRLYLFHGIALYHIALFDVIVILQPDAAFVPMLNLSDIILNTPQ